MKFALVIISDNHNDASNAQMTLKFQTYVKILTQLKETPFAVYDANSHNHKMYVNNVTHCYDNLDEMITRAHFDATIVLAHKSVPVSIVSRLLDAKKHVFLEWPFGRVVSDYESLLSIAQKRKVILDCNRIWGKDTAVGALWSMITNNTYGHLLALEFSGHGDMLMSSLHDIYGADYFDTPQNIDDCHLSLVTCMTFIYTANWLFNTVSNMVFARITDKATLSDSDQNTEQKSTLYLHMMLGYDNNTTAIILYDNIKLLKPDLGIVAVFDNAVVSVDFVTSQIHVQKNTTFDSTESTLYGNLQNYDQHLSLAIQDFIVAICNVKEKVCTYYTPRIKDVISATKGAKAALLSSKNGIPIYLDVR